MSVARPSDLVEGLAQLAERALPLGRGAGAAVVVAGLVLLTVATRRRRPLAALGGAALGALAALALRDAVRVHLGAGPVGVVLVAAIAGAAGCALVPGAFPFAAGALPGALLGAQVPLAGRALFGAAAGALLAGLVGLALSRAIATAVASSAGGLLVALGLLAVAGAHPLAEELAARPFAVVAFAAVVAIAGTAFQLATTPAERGARSRGSPPAASHEDEP